MRHIVCAFNDLLCILPFDIGMHSCLYCVYKYIKYKFGKSILHNTYMMLYGLSFHINIYAISFRNVIMGALGELYNVSKTSFINVTIKMTTSLRFCLSRDF